MGSPIKCSSCTDERRISPLNEKGLLKQPPFVFSISDLEFYYMPCLYPLQAFYFDRPDGKKSVTFSNENAFLFDNGHQYLKENSLQLPCGRCMPCRLERSRQWAVRCMHEASMWEKCCFLTLTYSPEHIPQGGTLVKKDLQDFMKRFRRRCSGFEQYQFVKISNEVAFDFPIRYFACGEYGEKFSRPHYHVIVFNYDFKDKQFLKVIDGFKYFTSELLSSLWGKGQCIIGDVTFESCAYVARYCTKKVNGNMAEDHYQGRQPEFMTCSLKPAIGRPWLDKFGKTDVLPFDSVVVRGKQCKPPRYYDKCFEESYPDSFAETRESRRQVGELKSSDNTFARLRVKEKCIEARIKQFSRSFEKAYDI